MKKNVLYFDHSRNDYATPKNFLRTGKLKFESL
jgi:hypothetical protein